MKTIAIVNHKGGVGKSSIAIHLANHFAKTKKTLLLDGDENRTASHWVARAKEDFNFHCITLDEDNSLFFEKADIMIIDSKARETQEELEQLAHCDLIIIPSSPDVVSLEPTLEITNFFPKAKILINLAPPFPSKEGEIARDDLVEGGFEVFNTVIRRSSAFPKAAYSGKTVEQMGKRFERVAQNLASFYSEVEAEEVVL